MVAWQHRQHVDDVNGGELEVVHAWSGHDGLGSATYAVQRARGGGVAIAVTDGSVSWDSDRTRACEAAHRLARFAARSREPVPGVLASALEDSNQWLLGLPKSERAPCTGAVAIVRDGTVSVGWAGQVVVSVLAPAAPRWNTQPHRLEFDPRFLETPLESRESLRHVVTRTLGGEQTEAWSVEGPRPLPVGATVLMMSERVDWRVSEVELDARFEASLPTAVASLMASIEKPRDWAVVAVRRLG